MLDAVGENLKLVGIHEEVYYESVIWALLQAHVQMATPEGRNRRATRLTHRAGAKKNQSGVYRNLDSDAGVIRSKQELRTVTVEPGLILITPAPKRPIPRPSISFCLSQVLEAILAHVSSGLPTTCCPYLSSLGHKPTLESPRLTHLYTSTSFLCPI
jgi:hypothetical protein